MINARITNSNGESMVVNLNADYFELYRQLEKVGYYQAPQYLKLRNKENEPFTLELYSESDIGNAALRLLTDKNSLYDAYLLNLAIKGAREEIREELEQNILCEQYSDYNKVIKDINRMKIDISEANISFYCPLTALLDERGEYAPATNYELSENRVAIENALKKEQLPVFGDMAECVGNQSGLGEKVIYVVWGVEEINEELYGKIDCYLSETPTEEETEKLRDVITGQNSDGFGESFEQHPVTVDDGDLYISFWNSNDDWFLYTDSEMDEYLNGQSGHRIGGI